MSYRYEFFADARDGRIELPEEIASRLRLKGISRLRVTITTAAEDEERLAARGIDREIIERVAAAQSFDPDVATVALSGEGSVEAGSGLAMRLRGLAGASGEAKGT